MPCSFIPLWRFNEMDFAFDVQTSTSDQELRSSSFITSLLNPHNAGFISAFYCMYNSIEAVWRNEYETHVLVEKKQMRSWKQ